MSRLKLRMWRQYLASEEAKFACLKEVLSSFFPSFLGFSMVKIHFLQKVLKKGSCFRNQSLYFFHFQRGGSRPKSRIFHFFNPSLIPDIFSSINFTRVQQIFFPHSLQLHPHTFPGFGPKDCIKNWSLKE